MRLHHAPLLVYLLIASLLLLPCHTIEGPIVTEQNTTGLSNSRLLVQILTEPENLIRIWEGWDLALQMLKIWAKNSMALATLPFNKEFLYNNKDFVHFAREMGQFKSGHMKRFYYAQVPTRNPNEAPRFIKMTDKTAGFRRDELALSIQDMLRLQTNQNKLFSQYEPLYGKPFMGVKKDSIFDHSAVDDNLVVRRKRSSGTFEPSARLLRFLGRPELKSFQTLMSILNEDSTK